jgi:hypothetical protein
VNTFDAYLWQTIENKQRFISQIMTSKSPARTCEDVDESVLSYAEIKALCTGNPKIREKMDLDVQVGKLKLAKSSHQSAIYSLQDKLRKDYPHYIKQTKERLDGLKQDEELSAMTRASESSPGFPGMTVMGRTYTDKESAGKALMEIAGTATAYSPISLGEYRGFKMSATYNEAKEAPEVMLKGQISHLATLGDSPSGNITRLNNALDGIAEQIAYQNDRLENLHTQVEAAKAEIAKPFPFDAELEAKSARLNELNIALNLDGGKLQPDGNSVPAEPDEPNIPAEAAKGVFSVGGGNSEKDYLVGQAKLKLGSNSVVIDAQRNRAYSGDVLEVGNGYAVQKISRGVGVVHSFSKAPGLLDMIETNGTKNLCVRYDGKGACGVSPEPKQHNQNNQNDGQDRESAACR